MTIEKIHELKLQYQNYVDYYGKVGFTILQGKFQDLVNFLDEIEAVIRERDELQNKVAQMTTMTSFISTEIEEKKDEI